ncbi:MAG: hypothetical protein HY548_08680 [Elusimicrobia bacterium]|nr:hypothetical protein [Elusimicrobiota bacterium]
MKLLFSITSCLFLISPLSAASRPLADTFLEEGFGARAQGMGNAQTALADDVHMLYWNPAGLTDQTPMTLAAYYNPAVESAHSLFFAYGLPVGPVYTAAGFFRNESRDIELTDGLGTVLRQQDFSQEVMSLSAGFSVLPSLFTNGLTVKYFRSKFAPFKMDGTGVDLGLQSRWRFLRAGFKWQDIGNTRLSGDGFLGGSVQETIPSRLRFGVAVALISPDAGRSLSPRAHEKGFLGLTVNLAADAVMPVNDDKDDSAQYYGSEIWFHQRLALRGGWSKRRGTSLGASAKVGRVLLDYAFLLHEEFNNLQRFSTNILFGKLSDD